MGAGGKDSVYSVFLFALQAILKGILSLHPRWIFFWNSSDLFLSCLQGLDEINVEYVCHLVVLQRLQDIFLESVVVCVCWSVCLGGREE